MTDEIQLSTAIAYAAQVHAGQLDKGGKPYILHPLWVMDRVLPDLQLAMIAVLHDVIEDSSGDYEWRWSRLIRSAVVSTRTHAALILLTRYLDDDYMDVYIEKICTNLDAVTIKMWDLTHNLDLTRLIAVTEKDELRHRRYCKAFNRLAKAKCALKMTQLQ